MQRAADTAEDSPCGFLASELGEQIFSSRDVRLIFIKKFIGLERPRYSSLGKQEMTAMKMTTGRRSVLGTFALTMASGVIGLASAAAKPAAAAVESALTPPGATHLDALKKRLAQMPRRRDFKTVPMILNHQEQWDHEALTEVLSYMPAPKQAC